MSRCPRRISRAVARRMMINARVRSAPQAMVAEVAEVVAVVAVAVARSSMRTATASRPRAGTHARASSLATRLWGSPRTFHASSFARARPLDAIPRSDAGRIRAAPRHTSDTAGCSSGRRRGASARAPALARAPRGRRGTSPRQAPAPRPRQAPRPRGRRRSPRPGGPRRQPGATWSRTS